MKHLPSLKQLQYLVALADYQSFSEAAEHCFVTQPTFSNGIAALESILGQPVADRSRSHASITLTPFGMDMVSRARDIIVGAEDLLSRAAATSNNLTGPLRLGIIPTVAPYMLPGILPPLQHQYPDLDWQITEDTSARLADHLKNGRVDMVLMAFPYPTDGTTYFPLFHEDFYLATPANKQTIPDHISPADLNDMKLLLLEEGHCLRDHAIDACDIQSSSMKEAFHATSLATLIQMVSIGMGSTLLPQMAVNGGTLPDGINIIPFANPRPGRDIGLIWRKNNPRARHFEILGKHMQTVYEQ